MADLNGTDLVVVGAGIIGVATAWQAARAGMRVVLVDPNPGSGATRAAAGVLAPLTGPHDATRSFSLARDSQRMYDNFVREVEAEAGFGVDYERRGTLTVATDPKGEVALSHLEHDLRERDLAIQQLTATEARAMEPGLSPEVSAALLVLGDGRIDPRKLATALLHACRLRGVAVVAAGVRSVTIASGVATGLRLDNGDLVAGRTVVLAAGIATARIAPPDAWVPRLRAVQGEAIVLRGRPGLYTHTLRWMSNDRSSWVVPRPDGRCLVGATVWDGVSDGRVRAAGVRLLLRDAATLLPGIDEFSVEETPVGQRPATDDGMPIIGWSRLPQLLLATGHLRKGIQEAPATARACVAMLQGSPNPYPELAPDRFVRSPV